MSCTYAICLPFAERCDSYAEQMFAIPFLLLEERETRVCKAAMAAMALFDAFGTK